VIAANLTHKDFGLSEEVRQEIIRRDALERKARKADI